jgi:uncharacterized membrane protein
MSNEREIKSELFISEILRWGVRASLAIIVVGIVLSFVMPGGYDGNNTKEGLQELLHGGTAFPRSFAWIVEGILRLDGPAVSVAGLGLLILTPILRVFASIVAFAYHKDRMYVAITLFVFALVVVSFFLGYAV